MVIGQRLGPYEVLAKLGEGGMGEVYRARDTKLNRDVAIKVLPDIVATDPDRLARFRREAQVLASLNHPNIAHIYGVEDSGGSHALVMELVEGPTIADRVAKGPMPVDEVLAIAKQIAGALETAHEQSIIHRDLKPANIKVRPDGTVKVLDFGLAKLTDPAGTAVQSGLSATISPTITSPALVTGAGVILGTAAYMSPEQAKGRAADKRSDIWAFGCVIYEMLAGRRPFEGEEVSETLAFILTKEPDWTKLPKTSPNALSTLLRRCLKKDPGRRLHDIADARIEIEETIAQPHDRVETPSSSRSSSWTRVAFPVVALLAGSALTGSIVWLAKPTAVPRVTRLEIAPAGTASVSINLFDAGIAITPDGSRVVYIGNRGTELFSRALDALEPTVLVRGELRSPFISPDGQWVGIVDGGQTIRKVAITGGPPLTVLTVPGGTRGVSWTPDNGIIFASIGSLGGLQYFPASGGAPTTLTRPNREHGELNHWWPEVLPGGHAVLFTIVPQSGGLEASQIAVLDLQTRTSKVLVRGASHARYVASGHLIYTSGGALRAVPFDAVKLSVLGPSVTVVPHVLTTSFGAVNAAVSNDDTLVYLPGEAATNSPRRLVWIDRNGHRTPLTLPERLYAYPRLSPDGSRIAVTSPEQDYDIWLWDVRRSALTRATFEPGQDSFPVWTRDGRRMIFASTRNGPQSMFWQAADGTGVAERLTKAEATGNPTAIAPDGRLIFSATDKTTGYDLMTVRLDDSRKIEPLLRTPANERNAEISPDGRWIAYQSDESGSYEVYVRPYPAVDSGRWQISTGGGARPLWSHSGRELFFVAGTGALMRIAVEPGATWAASTPTILLKDSPAFTPTFAGRTYDISLDDQQFLMAETGAESDLKAGPTSLIVVQHWSQELKRASP